MKSLILKDYIKEGCNKPLIKMLLSMIIGIILSKIYFVSAFFGIISSLIIFNLSLYIINYLTKSNILRINRLKSKEYLSNLAQAIDGGSNLYFAIINLCNSNINDNELFKATLMNFELGEKVLVFFKNLYDYLKIGALETLYLTVDVAVKTGADLSKVFSEAEKTISNTLEAEAEIESLLFGKVIEGIIMAISPFIFVKLLTLISSDYIKPLKTIKGQIILFILFLFQILCSYLFFKIFISKVDTDSLLSQRNFEKNLSLFLLSGLTISDAFMKASLITIKQSKDITFKTLIQTISSRLSLGISFSKALDVECNNIDHSSMIKLLKNNISYGSFRLSRILLNHAEVSEKTTINKLKKQGLKKDTFLLFPMAGMLFSALIICGLPAILSI